MFSTHNVFAVIHLVILIGLLLVAFMPFNPYFHDTLMFCSVVFLEIKQILYNVFLDLIDGEDIILSSFAESF